MNTSRSEGCTLTGALSVTTAVRDGLTVIHGPAGCAHHNFSLLHATWLENDAFLSPALISSGMQENDVIFGGEAALEAALHRAESMHPACIFVVSSCIPDTIGDDTQAVCAGRTAVPTCLVPTGGFIGGGFFTGYRNALLALSAYATAGDTRTDEVSIIGEKNLEYEAEQNYCEVARLLGLLGLRVGTRFVRNIPFDGISRLGSGTLNILREPSLVPVGRHLEERFGTPYISSFPQGFSGTIHFIERAGERLGINPGEAVKSEEALQKRVLDSFGDLQGRKVSFRWNAFSRADDPNLEDLCDALDLTRSLQAPEVPVPAPFPVGTSGIRRLLHRWRRALHA